MKLTIKNILVWAAGLLAVVAFCLMFAAPLKAVVAGHESIASASEIYFGKNGDNTIEYKAVASVIGFVLILVAGLAAVAVSFVVKDAKLAKLITLACAGVLLVGAIMVFCTKANYLNSFKSYAVKQGASRADAKDAAKSLGEYLKVMAGPVVAGILAVLSGAALAVSQLVKLDK